MWTWAAHALLLVVKCRESIHRISRRIHHTHIPCCVMLALAESCHCIDPHSMSTSVHDHQHTEVHSIAFAPLQNSERGENACSQNGSGSLSGTSMRSGRVDGGRSLGSDVGGGRVDFREDAGDGVRGRCGESVEAAGGRGGNVGSIGNLGG